MQLIAQMAGRPIESFQLPAQRTHLLCAAQALMALLLDAAFHRRGNSVALPNQIVVVVVRWSVVFARVLWLAGPSLLRRALR